MQKNIHADSSHDHKSPASPKLPAVDSADQLRARTAAKDDHIKEAGLGGNRTGKSSASGKQAQANRDDEPVTTPDISNHADASSEDQAPETHAIKVQVNTDHNIHGSEKLILHVQDAVNATLGRFSKQLTRVEIHLSDDNGQKSHGDDKRCLLEARPAGHQPLVVSHVGATVDEAVDGAVEMMEKVLGRTFAKLYDPKGNPSIGESVKV